jgi:hypothetical protein
MIQATNDLGYAGIQVLSDCFRRRQAACVPKALSVWGPFSAAPLRQPLLTPAAAAAAAAATAAAATAAAAAAAAAHNI